MTRRNARDQRGLSLVELMIAMVLGLILIGGVIEIYLSSRASYRLTNALAEVQEKGRFAIGFIVRNARMAGYVGCNGDLGAPNNVLEESAKSTFPFNFKDGVKGYDAQSLTSASWNPVIPVDASGEPVVDPVYGTDVIAIRGMQGEGVKLTEAMPTTSAELKVASTGNLQEGDVVMISDCSASTVFQITQVQTSAGHVQHNTGSSLNAKKDLGAAFQQGARIQKVSNIIYFIRASDGSHSCDTYTCGLWRQVGNAASPEELVRGVTDMQVLYGYDADLNGIPDSYCTAADITAAAGTGCGTGGWGPVVSVRIALLVRSSETATSKPAAAPSYTMLGEPVPDIPNDMHLRKVFTKTIALRNKLLK
ncbi:MAG TPA: PilW family protein [Gammaproteobacteria bacterium]|nr:PilW family protein [Gammaproteobacteria bacterium]